MKYKSILSFITQVLRKNQTWLILIIILGFTVRVLWWTHAKPIPVSDFAHYQHLAENLLKHHYLEPSAYRLPVYPIFLAIIMTINKSIAWLSFANLILSTLSIYVIYKFTLHITHQKLPALLSTIFCAFNPTFIFFSPILASEHLFVILFFLAFLLLEDSNNKTQIFQVLNPVFSGGIFGVAVLTRGDGLFYIPVLLIMTHFSFNKTTYKYLSVLTFILAFAVTLSPWLIRNYYVVGPGAGLSTTGGVNFYFAHNNQQYGGHPLQGTPLEEGTDEIETQKIGYQVGLEYISNANLARIAQDIIIGSKHLFLSQPNYSVSWNTKLPRLESGTPNPSKQLKGINWFYKLTKVYFPLMLVALMSILFVHRYTHKAIVSLYGIIIMNWIGYACVFWAKARYRYVSEYIFCILAALFFYEIIKYIQNYKLVFSIEKRI